MSNQVRIIGGEWRSRQLVFADAPGLRPTPSRVRETLFNWLQADILNSRCLDLYAGSGALGVEAASRGAKHVVQLENNPASCQKLRENIAKLAATQIQVVQQDVSYFLNGPAQPFDLVFLDPPFGQDLIGQACQLLDSKGWLANYAKIYLECERNRPLDDLPGDWRLLKAKTAGEVSYNLLQKQSDTFVAANGLK
ncbi:MULTISPECIES: 16S rRNA (guanine(966)-N(2))-methyltransferase RsmD [Methylomonas]|uniref:Ribosomal RNA small subunit methyltransferase D n=2 Tax=Methylomonas TaxID=416 RepID=A0A126T2T6_9GAMM|nr:MULTISPECIES: 16S rRNA (guanine(966)-N(2))-methyltransferase RsmD [Methylomonas]AMK76385.1 16S rRNA (guanine(966)-N(2))-methyltransferase RsmD [Methylomonas denitrificans]OAI00497.1 16S rRNA (guanine(966)-N(2))-methyltransferase RsmD [Methylomonas methanica]TCV88412.1 16S rRNA m(2)G-966 methyltransferase [Methylomonas methanica]